MIIKLLENSSIYIVCFVKCVATVYMWEKDKQKTPEREKERDRQTEKEIETTRDREYRDRETRTEGISQLKPE